MLHRIATRVLDVPSAIKHDGRNAYRFEVNNTSQCKALFAHALPRDAQLRRLLCHYELYAGFAALRAGQRATALRHLRAGARWRPHLRRGYALLAGRTSVLDVARKLARRKDRLDTTHTASLP